MKVFSDEQINSIKRDLQIWFGDEAAKSFDNSKDKAKWFLVNQDALLTNDQFVKNYDIDALISVDSKPMASLYNRYPNFDKLTENQIKRFTHTTGLSKDELEKYYRTRKATTEEIDKINKERYAQLNKDLQEYERTKGGYYNTPIANEYARKAYIQGNDKAALLHEIAGKAAGATDFAPWPISYIGPVIRTGQKYISDEEPWTATEYGEIAADFGGASLGGLGKIPGVKPVMRGVTGKITAALERSKHPTLQGIGNVVNKKAIAEEKELAKQELVNLSKAGNPDNLTTEELYKLYNNSEDPVIKAGLGNVYKARQELEHARRLLEDPKIIGNKQATKDAAANVASKQTALDNANNTLVTNMADYNAFLQAKAGYINFDPYGDIPSYYKDVPLEDVVKQYNRNKEPSFLSKALGEGILGVGRKTAGQSVAHRQWNEIDYKPDYNEDKVINEIIRMYSNDWMYGKPSNYNEPLIKAAYDKWLNDLRMKDDYNTLYRLGEIK